MGTTSEFSLPLRAALKAYRWRRVDPVPWTPLRRPLVESRLALVSSAALTLPEQAPFDGSARGGDTTFRTIPGDVRAADLVDRHPSDSFDHAGMRADANLAFPIDRLREMRDDGRIGELNDRHLSFSGTITAPGRLIKRTAPEAARQLADNGVDVALLVPV